MRLAKKMAALILLLCICVMGGIVSNAAVQVPETIKVGLFYDSTAASSSAVSAEKGLQIGISRDGAFAPLVREPSNKALILRKDSYYTVNGNEFTEYKPESKIIPAGERIGPYHVQLPGTFSDLAAVNSQLMTYKQMGITAYPVFSEGWQIWAGFYTDEKAAQSAIADSIQNKLGAGEYKVISPSPSRIVVNSGNQETLLVFDSAAGYLQLHPLEENNPKVFTINGKSYRGGLEVKRLAVSDMTIINVVSLEEYLYGVVPAEIQADSSAEALKAQAVAARTYAVRNMGKQKKWGFDLSGGTVDQVYKGYSGEAGTTNQAVDATKGKIVTYDGKTAEMFYFSSSGGKTESAKNVFGVDIPYLVSVEDNFESAQSRNYVWDKTLTSGELKALLSKKGCEIGDILSITVTKTSEAGRPVEILIKGTKGEETYVNNACRNVFGLDSQWFTISTDADIKVLTPAGEISQTQLAGKMVMTAAGIKTIATSSSPSNGLKVVDGTKSIKTLNLVPTTYTISGRGWGHAVGMSQEGAKGMAKAGYTYDQILTHYFPGTTIE